MHRLFCEGLPLPLNPLQLDHLGERIHRSIGHGARVIRLVVLNQLSVLCRCRLVLDGDRLLARFLLGLRRELVTGRGLLIPLLDLGGTGFVRDRKFVDLLPRGGAAQELAFEDILDVGDFSGFVACQLLTDDERSPIPTGRMMALIGPPRRRARSPQHYP